MKAPLSPVFVRIVTNRSFWSGLESEGVVAEVVESDDSTIENTESAASCLKDSHRPIDRRSPHPRAHFAEAGRS